MGEAYVHPGEAIRRRREELGLSVREVAKRAGVSYALIGALERGEVDLRKSRTSTIYGLLRALEWTPEEFAEATGLELPGVGKESLSDEEKRLRKELKRKLRISSDEELEEILEAERALDQFIGYANESIKQSYARIKALVERVRKLAQEGT